MQAKLAANSNHLLDIPIFDEIVKSRNSVNRVHPNPLQRQNPAPNAWQC
jgi:hypothetical protein